MIFTDGNEQATNYNEYSYEKAVSKSDKIKRILYFAAVVFIMILPILIAMLIPGTKFLLFIMPLFIILGIPLAKYFFKYFQTEYKYTVNRSIFKMELIHGKSKPKTLYECDVKDMEFAVPASEAQSRLDGRKFDTKSVCLVSGDSPDKYVTAFRDKNGKSVLLYFEGCKKSLKIMNYYNKNVTVSSELNH